MWERAATLLDAIRRRVGVRAVLVPVVKKEKPSHESSDVSRW